MPTPPPAQTTRVVVGPEEVRKWRFGRFKVTNFFGRLEPTPLRATPRGHFPKSQSSHDGLYPCADPFHSHSQTTIIVVVVVDDNGDF
jgi:hypothetical protein